MEYQTSSTSVTLSQTSTGHSIYDGVFTSAAPSNFTISSSFDDYREIFGTATSSSIPVLQVPELNERKASVDVRSSKLDYSNVFVGGGGFGDGGSDFALTYEELFAEPKKRTKLMHKETRIQIERVSPTKKKAKSKSSCSVESVDLPNESAFESYDGVKKFKMSYNRSNHRSKSFAGVHTVPAYTCSMDETSPLCSTGGDIKKPVTVLAVAKERAVEGGNSPAKAVTRDLGDGDVKVEDKSNWKSSVEELFNSNKPAPAFSSQVLCDGDKPVSLVINDASHVNGFERHNGASHHRQASRDQQAADASKQTFGGVPKAQNSSKWRSSGSIDKKNYSGEIAQESRPSNMPPFSLMPSEGKSEVEKSVVSMFGVSNADIFRGGDSVASPPYYDEEVDSNSVAAASVAALTKAIEEAQASIRMAKELMDRKKVGVQSRVKLSFDDSTKPELSKRNKLAERASMSTKTKSRQLYDKADVPANVFVRPEQVTPVLENVIISSDVMVPKEEMHAEKIADNGRIFKEVETRELHEEVDVALDVSAGPEQVSVAIEEADLKETRGKVHDEEFRPTPTDHRLEEVDDSEASEQFYEFADTGKEVISEAVEQFFEFADSSEPDVSEAADEFYEFSDSSEHRELKLENEEVNSTGQTFPLVDDDDDDDEQHKKTDMEDLDKPEQDSKSLEASTEEHREVESIFNVVRGISDFREHANELASSKEDLGRDDDDEKRQEALRELEESGKLEATHVNETSEEKQNGDDEKFESQELYETEHVKINLVTQEQVENEKTGMDACMQKDDERGQTDAPSEEDTERSLNKDSDEVTIETANDFYDKEDSDKRLEDDSESDGHDKLQDIKLNEMIHEEATYQKKECENSQEESFEVVDDGREQTDAHRVEDTERSLNKGSDEVIIETVNDFYDKEDIDKRLEDGSKSDGHDKLQDIKLNEMILEEATYQKKASENSQEENFEVVYDGRGQTDAHKVEDTERSLNKDSDEVTIATVNEFYDKEDSDKRLEDDSKSDGHDKLQDIKLNEMIHEEATYQKKECENSQEESFEVVDDGRGQTDAHRVEDTERSLNKGSDEVIIETVNDFYDKEDIDKRLEDGSKSDGHDNLQDIKLDEMILEEASYQKKECENSQEESFEVVDVGRMQILTDESTKDEKVKATQEDQKNLACEVETGDNLYEQGAKEDLYNEQGSARHIDYEQNVEETLEVPTKEDDGGVIEDAETLIELEENEQPLEMVEEKNDMGEKEICEPDDSTPSIKLPEMLKEKEEPTEIHSLHENEINASRNDTSFVQQQDDLLPSKPLECNLGRPVEEFEESGDINNDVMGAEVSVDQDSHKNSSTSRKRWFDSNEVSETFIKLEEDGNQSESVEEEDVIEEKEICEIEGLALGVKLAEILKQMEDVIDIPSCDTDGPSTFRNAMNSGKNHDEQLAGEPEVECNLGKHVEELGDMNKGSVEPEVAAVSPEQNINSSKSSHRKRWFDSGNETTVAQAPPIFAIHSLRRNLEQENYGHPETTDHTSQEMGRESRANLTTKKSGTNYTPQREVEPEKKENQQEAQTGKEFEVSATLQKELEREKEHRIQKAAKRKEREMQREQKKAVEQVMREARQRSFAEAQRAAEIRQKAEAQRRLGKTSVQANDTSLAEMASEEAKQKSERAYVERATQEARDRALEKALSEKIASEAGKQAKRSVSEKSYGVSPDGKQAKRSVSEKLSASSRDNGVNSSFDLDSKVSLSTSRSSSSLTQCDPSTANGESTQRCKAKLERNQRTAERAAKALEEKNKRDLLVQHEQAERNRLAEVLDAEVKRWSSGKERNLRALLSTLQYILGPDSGWQPVPLTDIVTAVAVKKAYRKAALCVHPDKLQQRGASIQQKYTCEKVFDLLKEAWNRFSAEER